MFENKLSFSHEIFARSSKKSEEGENGEYFSQTNNASIIVFHVGAFT
jgi:hypothetical protein